MNFCAPSDRWLHAKLIALEVRALFKLPIYLDGMNLVCVGNDISISVVMSFNNEENILRNYF